MASRGTGTSLFGIVACLAAEVAGALTRGASGAIGRFTSGRSRAAATGSGEVTAGAAGGMAAASFGAAAGGGIDIDVGLPATTGGCMGVGSARIGSGRLPSAGAGADAVSMGGAGASRMRKSLAPRRRSFHGRSKRGRPNVWPPSAMLRSSECAINESTSAVLNRRGSRGLRRAVLKSPTLRAGQKSVHSELPYLSARNVWDWKPLRQCSRLKNGRSNHQRKPMLSH